MPRLPVLGLPVLGLPVLGLPVLGLPVLGLPMLGPPVLGPPVLGPPVLGPSVFGLPVIGGCGLCGCSQGTTTSFFLSKNSCASFKLRITTKKQYLNTPIVQKCSIIFIGKGKQVDVHRRI